jgi:hypothetical protein
VPSAALTSVDGTGLVDCHLYEQPERLILHIVNLTSEATWRAPLDELIRVGPFKVIVRLSTGVAKPRGSLLVAGGRPAIAFSNGKATFEVASILDHEVVVLE